MRRARKASREGISRFLRLCRPVVDYIKLFRAAIYAALEHDSLTVAQATAYSAMVALFPALIAYAILKRNLFDLDAVLRASLVYAVATALDTARGACERLGARVVAAPAPWRHWMRPCVPAAAAPMNCGGCS